MTNRRSFIIRLLADLTVGCIVLGAAVRATHSANGAAFIAVLGTVVLAEAVAGYLEPSASGYGFTRY
jgi:ABC-type uncharacterized transport system permease subunit